MFLYNYMKSKILPILLSNILVAGVVWYAASPSSDTDASALAAKDKEIRELKAELSKSRSRNPRVGDSARQRRQPSNETAAMTPENEEAAAARRQEMAQRFDNFRKIRTNAHVSRLALRLNLTEEQKAQVLARAEERNAEIQALMEEMRAARESGQDMGEMQNRMRELMRSNNPDQYVSEFLTAEQKAEYDAYQQERTTARAETTATMSLAMVQEAIPLNQEQKDKYFAEYAAAAMNGRVSQEDQNKILKNVLTPEQYSVYEQQQQAYQTVGRPGEGRGRGGMRGGPGGGFGGGMQPPPGR